MEDPNNTANATSPSIHGKIWVVVDSEKALNKGTAVYHYFS